MSNKGRNEQKETMIQFPFRIDKLTKSRYEDLTPKQRGIVLNKVRGFFNATVDNFINE